jgi:SAM-dependent methyltransferase
MKIDANFYDKKYYEDGIASGKSCYTNYRWIPELTIPMAYFTIKELGIQSTDTVLDVGCSKGYFVKALRLLDVDAYGIDISPYAIEHADVEIKNYCKLTSDNDPIPFNRKFKWILTKDVLEHMSTEHLHKFFQDYSDKGEFMYHVVPLGDNGKFRIPEYHLDKSHVQINDEEWWEKLFNQYGWKIKSLKYKTQGIKENWSEHHPTGNGFFTLVRG